jgi:phosphoglycolate phosphatase-like HAD superfamily hydrolase
MKTNFKSYKKEIQEQIKQNIVIFDLDGCLADSDDFILTNLQAWQKEKENYAKEGKAYRVKKPEKKVQNDFSTAYLYEHLEEIKPKYGILELFVRLASVTNVAIVTSRPEIMRGKTTNWLRDNIIECYGELAWRQVRYKMFFNEFQEKSLVYKKNICTELMKTNKILLLIDDHPDVIDWAKSKGIETLVPGTGYKNLNDKDLVKEKQCLAK